MGGEIKATKKWTTTEYLDNNQEDFLFEARALLYEEIRVDLASKGGKWGLIIKLL